MASYIIWGLLIIVGIALPKSKFVSLLGLSYIFIIIAFCTKAPDLSNNMFMYSNIDSGLYTYYEPLYVALMRLCNVVGLDFTGFRCVLAFFTVLILYYALSNKIDRINSAISVLLIYPVIIYASGLRSAIPFSLIIWASLDYMSKNDRKNIIKTLILIMIASLIHYSSIFFLIIYIIKRKFDANRLLKVFGFEVLIILLLRLGILYKIVSPYINSSKVLQWISLQGYDHPSLIVDIIVAAMICGTAFIISRCSNESYYNGTSACLNKYCKNLNWIMIFLLPMLFLSLTFERYISIIISLQIIVLVDQFKMNDIRRIVLVLLGFLYNFAFYYVVHGNIFFPILYNNSFFQSI